MAKKISTTNTKQEILDAYHALLSEREKSETAPAPKETVAKADKATTPQPSSLLMKEIADLRIGLSQTLDEVEEKLLAQNKKLAELQDVVKKEEQIIEDLFGIKAQAESLAILLEAQKQQKAAFERETADTRENWKSEKETAEKARKREEEEYSYRIKRERQKEEDIYNTKKESLERELASRKESFEKEILDRQAQLKSQEEELKRLKALADTYPSELSKAIKETEKTITEKLETNFKHEKALLEKDAKAELQLRDERIKSYELKVKELSEQIKSLQARVDIAEKNAKDIVMKAIESSSERYDKSRYILRETDTKP